MSFNRLTVSIIIVIVVSQLLSYCHSKDISKRDSIVFQDSLDLIQCSIKTIIEIMSKLDNKNISNFFFDKNGFLFVNNIKLIQINSKTNLSQLYSNRVFAKLEKEEVDNFIKIIILLKENYISYCYFNRSLGRYVFSYRETTQDNYEDSRYIIYSDVPNINLTSFPFEQWKILDRKVFLILISH